MGVQSLSQKAEQTSLRHDWAQDEVMALFNLPMNDLLFQAATVHRENFDPNAVQISTLLSIKTGGCPENCKYCPQSAHYETEVEKEDLFSVERVREEALKAKDAGASRFCMGAAWRSLHDRDVPHVAELVKEVKSLGMETCVTLGMANQSQLEELKDAGLDYYNHNIDTSEEYYGEIISTRDFQDRIQTLNNIDNAGLKTCCGGIVGMGEGVEDRAKMLITLANRKEHPQSVPINMLVQVEGTPLHGEDKLNHFDFIRTIAVARIMMPQSFVRLSAGRETMGEETQALCFFAGANSIFYGEKLLTTPNPQENEDMALFEKLGIHTLCLEESQDKVNQSAAQ